MGGADFERSDAILPSRTFPLPPTPAPRSAPLSLLLPPLPPLPTCRPLNWSGGSLHATAADFGGAEDGFFVRSNKLKQG